MQNVLQINYAKESKITNISYRDDLTPSRSMWPYHGPLTSQHGSQEISSYSIIDGFKGESVAGLDGDALGMAQVSSSTNTEDV